jgi:hypothetical protein
MNNKNLKVAFVSFDGDTIIENVDFESVEDAWNYASETGSRYYFNPFTFVVSSTGATVIDAPYELLKFIGKRVKTVKKAFNELSKAPIADHANVDTFTYLLNN